MVGSLCAISPAHATDDQQQTVATSGFPAPWLTRCMILYGAHVDWDPSVHCPSLITVGCSVSWPQLCLSPSIPVGCPVEERGK